MELYGLRGITHGWGRQLALMSPEGADAVLAAIESGPEVEVVAVAGQPVQVREVSDGALDRLVARHGIVELDQPAWAARKRALGAAAVVAGAGGGR